MPLALSWKEVLVVFSLIALFVLLLLVYRLIRELIPTIRQLRRTLKELERTIQNSQEIIYNLKSISRNVDKEVQEAGEILSTARGLVDHVSLVTTTITKPVTGLRSVLTGIGYGMKYLIKGNRSSYESEEV